MLSRREACLWWGWEHQAWMLIWGSSPLWTGPTLLMPYPVRGRASTAWLQWPPVLTWAMGIITDIITDSIFSKATDPDMALDISSVWISPWPWWHHDPWTPTWYQTADQSLGNCGAHNGSRSNGHHPSPWPLQGHGPRHSPRQQPGTGLLYGLRWYSLSKIISNIILLD